MNRSAAKRSRIAIDAQVLRPAMSGVERSIHSLLPELAQAADNHDVIVFYPRCLPPPTKSSERFNYARPLIPNAPRPLRILWQQMALPLQLRLRGIDMLHAPAYTAPLLTRVPTVLTIYDTIALSHPELCKWTNALHYRLFMPRAARRAARVIVPSEATKRDVVRLLGVSEERIRVIPLGVSGHFRPIDNADELRHMRQTYGLPEDYILYLGNLEPKKNLPALLTAFAQARNHGHLTQKLAIAGQKSWHAEAIHETLHAHGLEESVIFLGPVPEAHLPALYSGASVFVFPSITEGFGLPPIEAMACGTPVITTQAGALPEVAGKAALVLPVADVDALRIAMVKITTNHFLRTRLRELGLKRAAQYSWKETARKTVAVYEEVLQER
jgi:glycosyltransferase involved in cell wall biosynthesis